MNDFIPLEDGITHVNVYSKSRCLLGRLLSNFAHTPFIYKDLEFQSVESWWYWIKASNINSGSLFPIFTDEQLDEIRKNVGRDAKMLFRELFKDKSFMFNPSQEELKEAYLLKLQAHPNIMEMLMLNELPFTHYYVMFDKKVSADDFLWTVELWEEIKQELLK